MNETADLATPISAPNPLHQIATWLRLLVGSRSFAAAFSLAMVVVAAVVIHFELKAHPWPALVAAMSGVPRSTLALAAGCVVVSYFSLALNERFALALLHKPQPFVRAAAAAAATYSISNSLGFSFATANAVRLRFYTAWGLAPVDVVGAGSITGLLVPLGGISAAGIGALVTSRELAGAFPIPYALIVALAVAAMAPAAIWLWFCRSGTGAPWRIGEVTIARPGLLGGAVGLGPAILDWIGAAAVLFILLPGHGGHTFPAFLVVFVVAGMLGAISGAPGGIGVFEAAILSLTPDAQSAHGVAAALVIYRLLHMLAPLVLTGLAMSVSFAPQLSRAGQKHAAVAVAGPLAPPIFATLTFIAGTLMLASGATPGLSDRLRELHTLIPLPITELSHLFGSVVGVLLLFVAAGLWRRLDAAYFAALGLLIVGSIFSVLKGFDLEEAVALSLLAGLLAPCHGAFARKTPLSRDLLSWPWLAAAAGVIGAVAWLGLIAYRHVDFADEMFWSFLRDGDAERSLRATTAAIGLVAVVGLAALVSPARTMRPPRLDTPQIAKIRAAIAGAEDALPDAALALLGDKFLMFSPSGKSFIMYAKHGGRWIAMSEPVGPRSERKDLLFAFREAADADTALPVFYSITAALLPDMIDQGMTMRKIGETAIVHLSTFSLDGKARANLRHARNRALKEGLRFEILPADDPATPWPALKELSNAWLHEHQGSEKGFSLGRFDPDYLRQFPLALLYAGSAPVALANLWASIDKRQLTVDLMRFSPDAPRGAMDALFVELMLWGKAQNYQEFDLGMAPLAGLENRRFSPLLSRLGALVYESGERVYGFKGLRAYKEKFDPEWRPLYVAAPPGVLLPAALADVALLTSGGFKGLLK
jgi:phosphatidylglycerol lysyltransferase